MRRLFRMVAAALGVAAVFVVAAWAYYGPFRGPETAFADFLTGKRPEAILRVPLVAAGPRVLPIVLAAIKDREMPRRRYAIAHLGCARYEPALPVLEAIIEDAGEKDYFRGDALIAAWQIAPERGEALIREYANAPGYLGDTARGLRREPARFGPAICEIES